MLNMGGTELEIQKMRGHTYEVKQFALTEDKKYLVSVSATEMILWSSQTGLKLGMIEENNIFLAISNSNFVRGIIHNGYYKRWSEKLIQSLTSNLIDCGQV